MTRRWSRVPWPFFSAGMPWARPSTRCLRRSTFHPTMELMCGLRWNDGSRRWTARPRGRLRLGPSRCPAPVLRSCQSFRIRNRRHRLGHRPHRRIDPGLHKPGCGWWPWCWRWFRRSGWRRPCSRGVQLPFVLAQRSRAPRRLAAIRMHRRCPMRGPLGCDPRALRSTSRNLDAIRLLAIRIAHDLQAVAAAGLPGN